MRDASLDLLKKLKEGDFRGMRIFGPPGVGKSCLVWLWACDEFLTSKKKVLWVHLMPNGPSTSVLMTGSKICKIKDADPDYIKFSDADIIVVDGVTESVSHDVYSYSLFYWEEFQNRKCIQVASTELLLNDEDEAVNKIVHFEMPPWTQQEFIAACRDDEFYNHVSCAFEGLRNETEYREELILEKFFYAGCSARWMFKYTAAEVKMKIAKQFNRCSSFRALTAVDLLWVGYPSEDGLGFSYFFVSQYVARLALTWCGDAEIRLLYTSARLMQNPELLGWVVEMDFNRRLHDCLRAKAQASVKTLVKGKASQRK